MRSIAEILERAAEAVLLLIKIIVSVLLIGSVLLIVATAAGRYFLNEPIRAQEEYLRYALTALVFLGAVLVSWDDRHLKMDLLSNLLGPKGRMVVNGLAVAGFLFVTIFAMWHSIAAVGVVGDAASLIADIPMIYPHIIIPISLGLMAVAVLARIGGHVRGDIHGTPELAPAPAAGDASDGAQVEAKVRGAGGGPDDDTRNGGATGGPDDSPHDGRGPGR